MGWLAVLIATIPAVLLWGAGVIWFIALGNAVLNFWSFGVMHNFATAAGAERIRQLRKNLEGEELTPERQLGLLSLRPEKNLEHVPNWLTIVNMASTIMAVGLLVYAFAA